MSSLVPALSLNAASAPRDDASHLPPARARATQLPDPQASQLSVFRLSVLPARPRRFLSLEFFSPSRRRAVPARRSLPARPLPALLPRASLHPSAFSSPPRHGLVRKSGARLPRLWPEPRPWLFPRPPVSPLRSAFSSRRLAWPPRPPSTAPPPWLVPWPAPLLPPLPPVLPCAPG